MQGLLFQHYRAQMIEMESPIKYIPAITALAERAVVTPLYNAGVTDDEIVQQCIITIEEYLKEQGV